MRRRLTTTTVAAALVGVLAFGLPLAVALHSLIYELAERSLLAEASAVATVLSDEPLGIAGERLRGFAASSGAELALVSRGGVVPLTRGFDDAVLEQVGAGASADADLVVSVPVDLPGGGWQLVVEGDAAAAWDQVRATWLQLGAVALAAVVVAAAVGVWQARELAAPLEALAVDAGRLGQGDFTARATRSGLPEPDMVAEALDATAERLGALVARANSLSADASHQLRTPLTALRLNLETLAEATDPRAATQAALDELDRLDATVEELLSLAVPSEGDEHVDPSVVVLERIGAWRTLAEAQGRQVETRVERVPRVRARPAAVGQALQVLLDNALLHGAGRIVVEVAPLPRDPGWVRITVADEGRGFTAPPQRQRADVATAGTPQRHGRGLVLARSLLAAEGGSLRVEHPETGARVSLLLRAAASHTPSRPQA